MDGEFPQVGQEEQWAYRLLREYTDVRKKLRVIHREYTERIDRGEESLRGEREWVGSMLNELTEVIPMIAAHCSADRLSPEERRRVERLRRLALGKKAKPRPWDPDWFRAVPGSGDFVDELVERLDGGGGDTEEVQLAYDFGLSRRQREVLDAVTAGGSYGQVARESGLKKGTVSRHLRLARKKCREQKGVQLMWKFD